VSAPPLGLHTGEGKDGCDGLSRARKEKPWWTTQRGWRSRERDGSQRMRNSDAPGRAPRTWYLNYVLRHHGKLDCATIKIVVNKAVEKTV
jgi:hypothetical protein